MAAKFGYFLGAFALLLVILFSLHVNLPDTTVSPPPLSFAPTPHPAVLFNKPPPLPSDFQELEMGRVIDSLLREGDYSIWCKLLSASRTRPVLPPAATLFVPENSAVLQLRRAVTVDRDLIPSHITPIRLSFSDLSLLKRLTPLPTLIPFKTILITDNSRSNFSIDGSPITQPNIYMSSSIAVHGIKSMFNYIDKPPHSPSFVAPISHSATFGWSLFLIWVAIVFKIMFEN